MDIDKAVFSQRYVHKLSVADATLYFVLIRCSRLVKGRRVCEQRSLSTIESYTNRPNGTVCYSLHKLEDLGLITIERSLLEPSQSKVATRRRAKLGSDVGARAVNKYYINKLGGK